MSETKEPRGEREDKSGGKGERDPRNSPLFMLLGAILGAGDGPLLPIHELRVEALRREIKSAINEAKSDMHAVPFDCPATPEDAERSKAELQNLITALVSTPANMIDGLVIGVRSWVPFDPEEHDDGKHVVETRPDGSKFTARVLLSGQGRPDLCHALLQMQGGQFAQMELEAEEANYQQRIAAGEKPCRICGEFHDGDEDHEPVKAETAAPASNTN